MQYEGDSFSKDTWKLHEVHVTKKSESKFFSNKHQIVGIRYRKLWVDLLKPVMRSFFPLTDQVLTLIIYF